MPWIYIRRRIARRWHVPPWVVDEAPADEVETELKIMEIIGECGAKDEA